MSPLIPASVGTDLGEQGRSGGQPLPVVNAVAESISGATAASCVPPAGATEGKPVLLDAYCGAGGATRGYQDAGFYVVGVDISPQPNYCGDEFHQADVLEVLGHPYDAGMSNRFAAIHASPPCQAWTSAATNRRSDHPELIEPTRKMLKRIGLPYVIENVAGAPLPSAFMLCGSTFGLPIIRHRFFECPQITLIPPQCGAKRTGRATDHGPQYAPYGRKKWRARWREEVMPVVWPWMTLEESGQAIPPAYTEYIGRRLLASIKAVA